MKLQSSIALLAVLALGCGDNGPRAAELHIAASANVVHLPTYSPGTWGEIPYTVTNRGDRPAFYGACATTAEQLVNGQWHAVSGPETCIMIGIELPGGRSDAGQVEVPGPGTYRLRMTYSDDSRASTAESVLSNVVTVE